MFGGTGQYPMGGCDIFLERKNVTWSRGLYHDDTKAPCEPTWLTITHSASRTPSDTYICHNDVCAFDFQLQIVQVGWRWVGTYVHRSCKIAQIITHINGHVRTCVCVKHTDRIGVIISECIALTNTSAAHDNMIDAPRRPPLLLLLSFYGEP